MKEFARKEYEIELNLPIFIFLNSFGIYLSRKRIFKYKQALFRDIVKLDVNDLNSEKWLFDFLNKFGKISKVQFGIMSPEKKVKIFQYILETYFKGMFEKPSNSKKSKKQHPFYAMIGTILERSGETLNTLMDYTWEQIMNILDGIVWNINEQTEKGRRINERKMIKDSNTRSYDSDIDVIRNMEKRLKSKKQPNG